MPRFLSTKPIQCYDKDGNFLGLHNLTRKTNMAEFSPCDSELSADDNFGCFSTNLTHYTVSHRSLRKQRQSLVDRGANGGIGGSDVCWIGGYSPSVHISVTGIGNRQINDIRVGTVGGVLSAHLGEVIGIFNNYAHVGDGRSIHSCIQLENLRNQVDDRHPSLGGKATIITNDGYVTPLSFVSGLPYLDIRPFIDDEYATLPHVMITWEVPWDTDGYSEIIDASSRTWFDRCRCCIDKWLSMPFS